MLAACWMVYTRGTVSSTDGLSSLASYLPGLIRSMRFGNAQAHGRANLLQFNYLYACGAISKRVNALSIASVSLLRDGLLSLANEILSIQGRGDYKAAKELVSKYCRHNSSTETVLQQLSDLPVDITISFVPSSK